MSEMNIIYDPWIFVEYLNGEKQKVSIKELFINAENIKDLDVPFFHKTKAYIYNVPLFQFLITIIGAVYFKPEHKFIAGNLDFSTWLKNNYNVNDVLNYLDKWENRFNLFDDKFPFLQEIELKHTAEKRNDYVSLFNPLAPSSKYPIFGNFRRFSSTNKVLDNYVFDEKELPYILLYLNSYGTSLAASQYKNKAISYKATLFAILKGENLKETLLYNCKPLTGQKAQNNDSDSVFDRPIWELDDKNIIKKYNLANLSKNTLLCSFFPCYPAWVDFDEEIKNAVISRTTDDCVFDEDARNQLSESFIMYHPFAIKKFNEKEESYTYKDWHQNLKISSICTEITKNLPDGSLCNVLDQKPENIKNSKCSIYYREFLDKYKTRIVSNGEYLIPQYVLEKLKIEENNNKAEVFQDVINKINKEINSFTNLAQLSKEKNNNYKIKFSLFAEQYFFNDFVQNIEKPDCLLNTIKALNKYVFSLVEADLPKNNPISFLNAFKKLKTSLNKLYKEAIDE